MMRGNGCRPMTTKSCVANMTNLLRLRPTVAAVVVVGVGVGVGVTTVVVVVVAREVPLVRGWRTKVPNGIVQEASPTCWKMSLCACWAIIPASH
jgi:hypothetical protein